MSDDVERTEDGHYVSSYGPDAVAIAGKMAEAGATNIEIANALGISVRTFSSWLSKHAELRAVLKVGKAGPDERVKASLFNRAVGYSYEAEKIFYNHKTGEVVRVPYIEHVPPETVACIFWTKNRMPDQFRDVKGVEHSGVVKQVHSVEDLSDDQIQRELANADRALAEAQGLANGARPEKSRSH